MKAPLLKVTDLTLGYDRNVVLRNVSVMIRDGDILGVVGPNGAGKTTLMRGIFGLLMPVSGRVEFDGSNISGRPIRDRMTLGMAYVPQERNVFPNLTVLENLQIATSALTVSPEQLSRQMDLAFTLFPRLSERKSQLAGTMSGGEQRMVAIAIGLMTSPRLLILDEPTTGLAPSVVHQLMGAVKKLNTDHGIASIVVEQNILSLLKIVSAIEIVKSASVSRFVGTPADLKNKNLWEFL